MKKFTKPQEFGFKLEDVFTKDEMQSLRSIPNQEFELEFDIFMTGLIGEYERLYNLCSQLYNKANKKGDDFVMISEPSFTVSYIEEKPLFDGSDEKDEFFTVDTYQNHTLFESRSIPTSLLKNSPVPPQEFDSGLMITEDGDVVNTKLDE